jgi:hypothetical protein
VSLAHLVVRDSLSICVLFAKRLEFQIDNPAESLKPGNSNKKSSNVGTAGDTNQKKSKRTGRRHSKKDYELSYDELIDGSRDLFDEDHFGDLDPDRSIDKLSSFSTDSQGNYQTEQAFHNNLESSISLIERSAKL